MEQKRIYLAEYLVGYGITWDLISEEEHKQLLLEKSLHELQVIYNEALNNNECDYRVVVRDLK